VGTLTVQRLGAVLLAAVLVLGCSDAVSANVAPTPAGASAAAQATSVATTTTTPSTTANTATAATPAFAHLIGQKLVVRMDGTTPDAALLGRIARGEVGGIILFGFNLTTRSALINLTTKLQATAKAGGQPRLLIAVDQEGGSIRRIPWAPPTLSVPHMGQLDSTTTARSQGASTGAALKRLGINVDFAPVADVPATTASFLYRQGRTWSFSAVHTASLSNAFASGLESEGVIPSMKHFPGLGFATADTDSSVVTIRVSTARLAPGLRPYKTAIAKHIPLIMLSNATYTAYDSTHAAGWSRVITETLLRHDLGFTGVTITDSLNGAAAARGLSSRTLAVRAAIAGTDMLLLTGSEASSAAVYATLLTDVRNGTIPKIRLTAAYGRILAMKKGL
jgi:beta-N-acetylhexosaminidase